MLVSSALMGSSPRNLKIGGPTTGHSVQGLRYGAAVRLDAVLDRAIVAAFQARMPFVAGNQHDPSPVTVGRASARSDLRPVVRPQKPIFPMNPVKKPMWARLQRMERFQI